MLTVMSLEWPGVTQDQYSQIMRALDFDKKPAGGEILRKERLESILQKVGVSGQPKIEFLSGSQYVHT
jgi:hypothetical protein